MIGDLYRVVLATSEPGRGSGYDTHRLIAKSYQQHMHMMTNTQIRNYNFATIEMCKRRRKCSCHDDEFVSPSLIVQLHCSVRYSLTWLPRTAISVLPSSYRRYIVAAAKLRQQLSQFAAVLDQRQWQPPCHQPWSKLPRGE